MYCRASATLAITSSSQITVMRTLKIANPLQSPQMKILAMTLIGCCASAFCASAFAATLPLHDCRLVHPLALSSVAARCGTLRVAEDPANLAGAAIDLSVAVVPALDRRSRAAPLFLLAGGPGQSAQGLYASFVGAFARI